MFERSTNFVSMINLVENDICIYDNMDMYCAIFHLKHQFKINEMFNFQPNIVYGSEIIYRVKFIAFELE